MSPFKSFNLRHAVGEPAERIDAFDEATAREWFDGEGERRCIADGEFLAFEIDADAVYRVMRAIIRTVHAIQRRLSMQQVELTNYIYKQHGKY